MFRSCRRSSAEFDDLAAPQTGFADRTRRTEKAVSPIPMGGMKV
jgi:hypothetical protein